MPDDDKHPIDRLLEALVFAPVGFVVEASTLVPELVERGRRTVDAQVATARVLGRFAVAQGQRELDRRWAQWRGENPAGEPSPEAAEPAPEATERTPADAAPAEGVFPADPADPGPPAAGPAEAPVTHDVDAAADLAIPDYDSLAASQVVPRLPGLSAEELEAVRRYELAHRGRRTILSRVAQLQAAG